MVGKLAYICSPYRADTERQFERQLEYTKQVSRATVMNGYDVIVPHLYYTQFLDDKNDVEREIGINSALNLIIACDVLIVCERYGISSGMKKEIEFAEKLGTEIKRV